MIAGERSLLSAVEPEPRSIWFWTGASRRVPSVTVRSLTEFLRECAMPVRRGCMLAYRGQTRDYCFPNGTATLLTARERQSTNYVTRFPGGFFDASTCTDLLFKKLSKHLRLAPRREGGPSYRVKAETMRNTYYKLLVLQGLLQHYGYPTVCVDLTANPSVALWFALHSCTSLPRSDSSSVYITFNASRSGFGVVYVLEVPAPSHGRWRKLLPNVLTANLAAEIPNPKWRPASQSAMTISQNVWSTGPEFNSLAGLIKKRLVVSAELLSEPPVRALTIRNLFPPTRTDAIYRMAVSDRILRENVKLPALFVVYPDYRSHFLACAAHSPRECFGLQPSSPRRATAEGKRAHGTAANKGA